MKRIRYELLKKTHDEKTFEDDYKGIGFQICVSRSQF